ncbi:S8 family peptidase [Lactiplantibacillus paraplantarum]|uniref:S8 family peptidase n=1 Tax=Lactiplantibacillus paraplantarum TaxID=60520 RepID=UPI002551E3D5|nr:S8 family serine peptidase [Lactiplantibacillus paraplantarum]MDL2063344.1 S8 family serine peptidase [Lactiplantibacillus paraplantarum]
MKINLRFNVLCFFSFCSILTVGQLNANANEYQVLLKKSTDVKKYESVLKREDIKIDDSIPEIGYLQVDTKTSEHKSLSVLQSIGKVKLIAYSGTQSSSISPSESRLQQSVTLPTLFSYQWDMQSVTHNGDAYEKYFPNKESAVGIIDSGVMSTHPALENQLVGTQKNFVPKNGYDGQEPYEDGNRDFTGDLKGHGTVVAGQISAKGLMNGIAPGIGIRSYRVFGKEKSKTTWILKAIVVATQDRVKVINLSLGQYLPVTNPQKGSIICEEPYLEEQAYKSAVQYALSRKTLIVAATGEDGTSEKQKDLKELYKNQHSQTIGNKVRILDYPASIPGVISVGSSNNENCKSTFSNYYEKKRKNFVLAPGGDTILLRQYGKEKWFEDKLFMKESILSTTNDGNYNYQSGTSLSAGKVSGLLAEIIGKYNLQDSPQKAVQILLRSCSQSKDGYRIIDADTALGQNY